MIKEKCLVKNCDENKYRRRICVFHYVEFRKDGTIDKYPKITPVTESKKYKNRLFLYEKQGESWKKDYKSGMMQKDIAVKYNVKYSDVDTYLRINKIFQNRSSISKIGNKNPMWIPTEEKIKTYAGIHGYIKSIFPKPEKCQNCNTPNKKLDLANISYEYYSDISDWEYLCRSCHMKKDGRFNAMSKAMKIMNLLRDNRVDVIFDKNGKRIIDINEV